MSFDSLTHWNAPQRKVHVFVAEAVKASGKTPAQIAQAMGYTADLAAMIEMIMDGRSKLPIGKVVSFAKAVGLEPSLVFETVIREYSLGRRFSRSMAQSRPSA